MITSLFEKNFKRFKRLGETNEKAMRKETNGVRIYLFNWTTKKVKKIHCLDIEIEVKLSNHVIR